MKSNIWEEFWKWTTLASTRMIESFSSLRLLYSKERPQNCALTLHMSPRPLSLCLGFFLEAGLADQLGVVRSDPGCPGQWAPEKEELLCSVWALLGRKGETCPWHPRKKGCSICLGVWGLGRKGGWPAQDLESGRPIIYVKERLSSGRKRGRRLSLGMIRERDAAWQSFGPGQKKGKALESGVQGSSNSHSNYT